MANKNDQLSLFAQADSPPRASSLLIGSVAVREVRCRDVLNCRATATDYSFNCYTGCSNGCAYCYARYMQRFHPHDEAWGRFVDVKVNAAEALARQVRRVARGDVFTCSACDGWQPVERHYELTRQCCRLLLDAGFSLTVLTKSDLVLRDLGVFAGRNVCLGVTITCADAAIARLWEPGASPVPDRVKVLKRAKAAGVQTLAAFGPLLPGISDTEDGLRALFSLAAESNVDRIWTDGLNLRPRVWESVQTLLSRNRPDLLRHYRRILFDKAARARYDDELQQRIERIADEFRVRERMG